MSLMYSLKKIVDPNAARIEEARNRRLQEDVKRAEEGDDTYRCRVCGFVSKSAEYCPSCLADTMECYRISIM